MLRHLSKLILMVFLLALPVFVNADVLYVVGSSVRLAWDDPQTDIEYYEVILIRDGTGVVYGPYYTALRNIEIRRPKSGIYVVRVRGWRNGLYSEWHSSTDGNAMLRTGVNGRWKAFFKLLGPIGPIIIY